MCRLGFGSDVQAGVLVPYDSLGLGLMCRLGLGAHVQTCAVSGLELMCGLGLEAHVLAGGWGHEREDQVALGRIKVIDFQRRSSTLPPSSTSDVMLKSKRGRGTPRALGKYNVAILPKVDNND